MTLDRQVYLLDPKELSPETIAVAFAKTSRSPQSFREIAAELTEEQSAEFNEKWVVGYGHSSVAEHAVLHIAIENVSRLAVECLESNRLASYTEKSTRYQKWDAQAFYIPSELDGHPLRDLFIQTCEQLFNSYQRSIPMVRRMVGLSDPRRPEESELSWDKRVRSKYVDVCRYLLPAASLANLGMTANARVLEHAICKMLSDPLQEVREIGAACQGVAQAEVPTLVKYANPLPYLEQSSHDLLAFADANELSNQLPEADWCTMWDFDPQGEDKILAALLVRHGNMDMLNARRFIEAASYEQKVELADVALGKMGPHDDPFRELEHTTYTFEVVIDQGAYFELKRHRMMTQSPQRLTARLGYAIPAAIIEAGFENQYREVMDQTADAYESLYHFNPDLAGYVVPNGCLRRVLLTMNLRAAFHLCELRSADNAHFAIRRLAQRIAAQIRTVHPILGKYIRTNPTETWEGLDNHYFAEPK